MSIDGLPTFASTIDSRIRKRLESLHTGLPGRVESFDAEANTVDVQPLVRVYQLSEDGTEKAVSLPVIPSVPVAFPGGGGYRLTWPIVAGETVWLLFGEASIERWWTAQGSDAIDPKDKRRFHLSDAIALPGARTKEEAWSGVSSRGLTLGKDGGPQLIVTDDGLELGGNEDDQPTDYVALASLVKQELEALKTAMQTGFTTIGVDLGMLKTHTHPVVINTLTATPSVALTAMQNPSDPSNVGDVKSAKVKSK